MELSPPNLDPKLLAKGGRAMERLSKFWQMKGEFLRSKIENFSAVEWIVFYDQLHEFLDNDTELGMTNFWTRLKPSTQLKVCELFVIKDQDPMRFQIIHTKEKADLCIVISGEAEVTNDQDNEVLHKKTGSILGALEMFNDPKHVKDEEDEEAAAKRKVYTVKIECGCCLRLSFSDYIKYIVFPSEAVEDLYEESSVLDASHTNAMAAAVLSQEICEFLENCSLLPSEASLEEEDDISTLAEESEAVPLEDETEEEAKEEAAVPNKLPDVPPSPTRRRRHKKKKEVEREPWESVCSDTKGVLNTADALRNVVQAGSHSVVTFRKYDIRMVYVFLKGEAQISVSKRGSASTIAYKRKGERAQKIESKSMPLLKVTKGAVVSFCDNCFRVGQTGTKVKDKDMPSSLKRKIQRIQEARSQLGVRKNLKLAGLADVYTDKDYELVINFLGPTVYLSIPYHVYAAAMKEYCLVVPSRARGAQGMDFQINSFTDSIMDKLGHLSNWLQGELTVESGGEDAVVSSSSIGSNPLYHTKSSVIPPAIVIKHTPHTRNNLLTASEQRVGGLEKQTDNNLMGTYQFGSRHHIGIEETSYAGPSTETNRPPRSPFKSNDHVSVVVASPPGGIYCGVGADSHDNDSHRPLLTAMPSASMSALHLGSRDDSVN